MMAEGDRLWFVVLPFARRLSEMGPDGRTTFGSAVALEVGTLDIEELKIVEINVHLLVRPDGMTREELTAAMWPGMDEAQAGALLDETVQNVNAIARSGNK